jgi:hypothetical protein
LGVFFGIILLKNLWENKTTRLLISCVFSSENIQFFNVHWVLLKCFGNQSGLCNKVASIGLFNVLWSVVYFWIFTFITEHAIQHQKYCKEINNMLMTSIRVMTKLPNSGQSYKGKVKTHKYINRHNQSTTGKLWKL